MANLRKLGIETKQMKEKNKANEARERATREDAARLNEAKDSIRGEILGSDKGGESIAEGLVGSAEVKEAVLNPELIEGLLEKLSTKGYEGKGSKAGQEIMKMIVEQCEKSPKLLNKILDYAKSGSINNADLTNYTTFKILLKHSEKNPEELFNLITKNRNGTNSLIENCQIHPEPIKLIYKHIKQDNRKLLTLNRQSIQVLLDKTGKKDEIIAAFTKNPQNSSRLLEAIQNFPKMLKSVFDKYKEDGKLQTLPPEAVVIFMESGLGNINNIDNKDFTDDQIFQIMRNGLGTPKIYERITPPAITDFHNPNKIVLHEAVLAYMYNGKDIQGDPDIFKSIQFNEIRTICRRKNVPSKCLKRLGYNIKLPEEYKDNEEPIKALNSSKRETLSYQVQGLFKSEEIIVTPITKGLQIKQNPDLPASKRIKDFPPIKITTDTANKTLTINISKYRELPEKTKTFNADELKTLEDIKKYLEPELEEIYETANKEAPIEKYLSMDKKTLEEMIGKPVKIEEEIDDWGWSEYTAEWWAKNIKGGFLTKGPIITKILEGEPFNIKGQKIYEALANIYIKGNEEITIENVFKATDVKFDFETLENNKKKKVKITSSEELINHFENIKGEYNNALFNGDAEKIKYSREAYLNLIGFFGKINTLINAITTTKRLSEDEKTEANRAAAKAAKAPVAPEPPAALKKYNYTKKAELVPSLDSLKGKPDKLTQEIQKIIPDKLEAQQKSTEIVLTNKFDIKTFPEIKITQDDKGGLDINIPAFRENPEATKNVKTLNELKTFLDNEIEAMLKIANVDKNDEDLPKIKIEKIEKFKVPTVLRKTMKKKTFEEIHNHLIIKHLLENSPFNIKDEKDRNTAINRICKNQNTILKVYNIDGAKTYDQLNTKLKEHQAKYNDAQTKLINKPGDVDAKKAKKDAKTKILEITNDYKKITQLMDQLKTATKETVGKGKDKKLKPPAKLTDFLKRKKPDTRPSTEHYKFSKKAPVAVTRSTEGLFGHLDHIPGSIGELRGIIKDIELTNIEINDTKDSKIKLIDHVYLEKTSEKNVIRLGILETSKIIPPSISTKYFKPLKLKTLPEENAIELNGKKYITEKELKKAIKDTLKNLFDSIPKKQKITELLEVKKQNKRIDQLNTEKQLHDPALDKLSAEEWETKKEQISQFKTIEGVLTGKLGVVKTDVHAVLPDIIMKDGKITLSKIIQNDKINSHLNTGLLDPELIKECFSKGNKIENTEGLKTFYAWLVKELGKAEKKAKEKPEERAKEEEKAIKYRAEIIKIGDFLNSTEKLTNLITISRLPKDKPELGKKEVKEPDTKNILSEITTIHGSQLRVRKKGEKIKIDFSDGEKWFVAKKVSTEKIGDKETQHTIKNDDGRIIYRLTLNTENKITHVESRNIAFGGTPGGIAKPLSVAHIEETRELKGLKDSEKINYMSSKLDGKTLIHQLKHKTTAFTLKKEGEKYKVKIENNDETSLAGPLTEAIGNIKSQLKTLAAKKVEPTEVVAEEVEPKEVDTKEVDTTEVDTTEVDTTEVVAEKKHAKDNAPEVEVKVETPAVDDAPTVETDKAPETAPAPEKVSESKEAPKELDIKDIKKAKVYAHLKTNTLIAEINGDYYKINHQTKKLKLIKSKDNLIKESKTNNAGDIIKGRYIAINENYVFRGNPELITKIKQLKELTTTPGDIKADLAKAEKSQQLAVKYETLMKQSGFQDLKIQKHRGFNNIKFKLYGKEGTIVIINQSKIAYNSKTTGISLEGENPQELIDKVKKAIPTYSTLKVGGINMKFTYKSNGEVIECNSKGTFSGETKSLKPDYKDHISDFKSKKLVTPEKKAIFIHTLNLALHQLTKEGKAGSNEAKYIKKIINITKKPYGPNIFKSIDEMQTLITTMEKEKALKKASQEKTRNYEELKNDNGRLSANTKPELKEKITNLGLKPEYFNIKTETNFPYVIPKTEHITEINRILTEFGRKIKHKKDINKEKTVDIFKRKKTETHKQLSKNEGKSYERASKEIIISELKLAGFNPQHFKITKARTKPSYVLAKAKIRPKNLKAVKARIVALGKEIDKMA